MKTQKIGKLKLVKNTDFVRVVRASHSHSITKEQQHEGKPQPVYLGILHNSESKSFPRQRIEFILIKRGSWERVSESIQC